MITGGRVLHHMETVGPDTLVLCSSYSGDTEETLACFEAAGAAGVGEREVLHAAQQVELNPLALVYLNRLSDLLFILARHANRSEGDVLWVPGGERSGERSADAAE